MLFSFISFLYITNVKYIFSSDILENIYPHDTKHNKSLVVSTYVNLFTVRYKILIS